MKRSHFLYTIAIIAATLPSCQKVIHLDLNSADPRYVVEANVTDEPGPYLVKISKTTSFENQNIFPAVSGAKVAIADITAGITDTLQEVTPGNYTTSVLAGISGHTYQLYINTDGNVFTSTATLPAKVMLDSLYMSKSLFGDARPAIIYTDPAAKGNYYYFAQYKNGAQTDNIYIRNDQLINGQLINQTLSRGGGDVDFNKFDTVTISLQCIDSATYQYYFTLSQTKNQNAATPANPQTNIKGGTLGYFSAHTVSTKKVVVE